MAEERCLQLIGRSVMLRPFQIGDGTSLVAMPTIPEGKAACDPSPDRRRDADPVTRLTIVVGGQIAGVIELKPERSRRREHVWIDMLLERGPLAQEFGTDAITTLVRHLVHDCGHQRVAARPATGDLAAIRCYEEAGFRRVGVLRQARCDRLGAWRDALLMEWVHPD